MYKFLSAFRLLLILGLLTQVVSAQGIEFFHGSWDEALTAAKKQRKLIFVDAYTEWCGPCKMMARNTFPDGEVGTFHNKNFINYKFDMEKGEGPRFAMNYQVSAYPTLLYINHKGDLVHKTVGYKPPAGLLTESRKAMDPSRNQALLELEAESGTASPEQLYQYAMNLKSGEEDYTEAAAKYFATQTEKQLLSEINWQAMQELTTDIDGSEFQYLIAKHKKFYKKYGQTEVDAHIFTVFKKSVIASALKKDEEEYQYAIRLADSYLKDDGQVANRMKLTYAEASKNWEDYAHKVMFYFDHYQVTDSEELNHAAYNFYKHVEDKEKLKTALRWSRQAIALKNAAAQNNTHAHLLYKLGRYQEALKFANKAVQLAILQDEDPSESESLIEKISEITGR